MQKTWLQSMYLVFCDYGDISCGTFFVDQGSGAVVTFAYTRFVNENIDYSDIRMWRNNPELILRKSKNYAYRWGSAYDDKEDLQMVIAEAILKMIERFDPSYGTSINGQIYMAAKRAVMDYG